MIELSDAASALQHTSCRHRRDDKVQNNLSDNTWDCRVRCQMGDADSKVSDTCRDKCQISDSVSAHRQASSQDRRDG